MAINICRPSSAGGAPTMATLLPEIDIGVPGRVLIGDKDTNYEKFWKGGNPSKLPAGITFELMADTDHECLNEDPR
eukprot:SAG22_NODE_3661_length_1587_cov_1.270833_1_plen_76_part_00